MKIITEKKTKMLKLLPIETLKQFLENFRYAIN